MKTTKLTIALFAMTGAALHAIAGASTSGTTLTLSADSGETYTHNDAIPSSITTINKTGAGEVALAAASPNCAATSVAIQSGTLTIADLGALGASAPITGWGYTTLRLKTPRGASSTDGLFLNHLITLGNNCVFEYAPTTEGADSDRLISALGLGSSASGGAELKSDARWGIYAGRLNPNGFSIRKTGSGELFLENTILGAGDINLNAGKMAFKGNMTFNATSANTFNYTIGASGLSFHSVTAPFPYALTLTAWRTLTIASGSADNMNVFTGPVTVNSGVTVTATGDDCSMRFDGPVRSGTNPSLTVNGGMASIGLNGEMNLAGTLRLSNAGGRTAPATRCATYRRLRFPAATCCSKTGFCAHRRSASPTAARLAGFCARLAARSSRPPPPTRRSSANRPAVAAPLSWKAARRPSAMP